jgi:heme exporter protein CcmD
MNFASDHSGYVIASYGLSALVLVGLCLWIIVRDRSLARKLGNK